MNILDIPNDDRIVPAHFQRQYLVGPIGELTVERDAGLGRAGKQQAVDIGMCRQYFAGFRATLGNTDDAFGNSRLMIIFDEHLTDSRGFFRRFENNGIARNQCRNNMPVGQMRGKIIGTEHGQHAVRFMPQRAAAAGFAVQPALRCAVGIGLDRDIDLVDDRLYFGPRFPQWFTGFAGNEVSKYFDIDTHPVGKAAHAVHPVGQRCGGPYRPSLTCSRDLAVDIAYCSAP